MKNSSNLDKRKSGSYGDLYTGTRVSKVPSEYSVLVCWNIIKLDYYRRECVLWVCLSVFVCCGCVLLLSMFTDGCFLLEHKRT